MSAGNQGRYLTIGQLSNYLGVSNRSVAKMFDRGYFKDSFLLPGSADRRVPLLSAISFARQSGMVDAARDMERLALEQGLPTITRPSLAILSLMDFSSYFPQFEVTNVDSLFEAGLLFAARPHDALLVSGSIGARECQQVARHLSLLPNVRTLSGILMLEDWSDAGAWLSAGYRFAWKLPIDMEIVAGELYAACTSSPRSRRKSKARA